LKELAGQQSHLNETHDSFKEREYLDRMLEEINRKLAELITKAAAQDKLIAANRQLLDSTRGELIKNTQTSEQTNQLRSEMNSFKE